ncbi:Magnesium transporter MRS2-5 [Orobanche gracilis]
MAHQESASFTPESIASLNFSRYDANRLANDSIRGPMFPGLKKRGHNLGSRSWILIDPKGDSKIVELDKFTVMRRCSLPSRDLRLLDPLFINPSTILGREKAIVVSLEQIRCIITADEVILKNSLDGSLQQYNSELCKRLETSKDQYDDLPFEFRALELALELTCMSLDAQVKELELEIYPVLDELASSISTLNLERVRRFKGHLLALTQRVQKVCDEIEHLMDDDGDMAEMYLTEKKEKMDNLTNSDSSDHINTASEAVKVFSKSAPVSPVGSSGGIQKLPRAFSSMSSSKQGSLLNSSGGQENIDQLEMLLEAYFVIIDNTLNKLLSLKEYIDDTEDLINIKLGNVQNQLIQFELLLTAATFVTTVFAVVTAVFGMNFNDTIFDNPSTFNWVLIITGVFCAMLYSVFLMYFKHKKVIPL